MNSHIGSMGMLSVFADAENSVESSKNKISNSHNDLETVLDEESLSIQSDEEERLIIMNSISKGRLGIHQRKIDHKNRKNNDG